MNSVTFSVDRRALPARSFLRLVLLADAASSFAMGLLLVFAARMLAQPLGLPVELLLSSGAVLLPFAAFVAYVGSRNDVRRIAVWIIIAANAVWVIDSIALLFTGWIEPTMLGVAFVLVQATAVAVLAALEYVGLRKAHRA